MLDPSAYDQSFTAEEAIIRVYGLCFGVRRSSKRISNTQRDVLVINAQRRAHRRAWVLYIETEHAPRRPHKDRRPGLTKRKGTLA